MILLFALRFNNRILFHLTILTHCIQNWETTFICTDFILWTFGLDITQYLKGAVWVYDSDLDVDLPEIPCAHTDDLWWPLVALTSILKPEKSWCTQQDLLGIHCFKFFLKSGLWGTACWCDLTCGIFRPLCGAQTNPRPPCQPAMTVDAWPVHSEVNIEIRNSVVVMWCGLYCVVWTDSRY